MCLRIIIPIKCKQRVIITFCPRHLVVLKMERRHFIFVVIRLTVILSMLGFHTFLRYPININCNRSFHVPVNNGVFFFYKHFGRDNNSAQSSTRDAIYLLNDNNILDRPSWHIIIYIYDHIFIARKSNIEKINK